MLDGEAFDIEGRLKRSESRKNRSSVENSRLWARSSDKQRGRLLGDKRGRKLFGSFRRCDDIIAKSNRGAFLRLLWGLKEARGLCITDADRDRNVDRLSQRKVRDIDSENTVNLRDANTVCHL